MGHLWHMFLNILLVLDSFTSKPAFLNDVYPQPSKENLQLVFCYVPLAKIMLLSLTLWSLYYEISGYFGCASSNYMHIPGHHYYSHHTYPIVLNNNNS